MLLLVVWGPASPPPHLLTSREMGGTTFTSEPGSPFWPWLINTRPLYHHKVLQIRWKLVSGVKNNTAGNAANPGRAQFRQADGWTPWFRNSLFLKPRFPIKKKLLLEVTFSLVVFNIQRGNAWKDLDCSIVISRLSATIWYGMRICIQKKEKYDEGAQKLRDSFNNGNVERPWTRWAGALFFTCWKSPLCLDWVSPDLSLTTKIIHQVLYPFCQHRDL